MSRKLWSREEDQKLCDLVNRYDMKWNEIVKHFKDRTIISIQKRWTRIDPSFASGKWEPEEDADLIEWIMKNSYISIDSFTLNSKPRRKHDVIKRIEYYKQILESQVG